MIRIFKSLLCAVVIFSFSITTVLAASPGGSFALGIVGTPDYEGSNDYQALPVLVGRHTWASGRYVNIGGTAESGRAFSIKANIIANSTWEAGPVVQYRLGRDGGVEDSQIDAMDDIDDAIELGAFIGETQGPMYLGLTAVADVSDEYDGYLVELAGTYTSSVNDNLTFITGADISYADSNYTKTYFGVNAADSASSGIPVYKANGAIKDVGLSLTAKYKGSTNWGLLGFIKYNLLLSDASDSPLVDDEGEASQVSAGAAVFYTY